MNTTTTRKAVRKSASKTVKAVKVAIMAVLDADMPAKVTLPSRVIEPDFFEAGMAYWIGADGTVACDMDMLPKLERIVEGGSFKARQGHFPCESGLVVTPFRDDFAHPASTVLSKNGDAFSQWRIAQDTLLVG